MDEEDFIKGCIDRRSKRILVAGYEIPDELDVHSVVVYGTINNTYTGFPVPFHISERVE